MMEQLKKRGILSASRYLLCGEAEEEINHLLTHCPSMWSIWESIISIPGSAWVWPYLVKDLVMCWNWFSLEEEG